MVIDINIVCLAIHWYILVFSIIIVTVYCSTTLTDAWVGDEILINEMLPNIVISLSWLPHLNLNILIIKLYVVFIPVYCY